MDATRARILGKFLDANFEAFERFLGTLGDDEPGLTAESIILEIYFQAEQAKYAARSRQCAIGEGGFTLFQDDWRYHAPAFERWRGHQVEVFYTDDVASLWVILPDGQPVRATRYEPAAAAESEEVAA
jgi:hypothetical protein